MSSVLHTPPAEEGLKSLLLPRLGASNGTSPPVRGVRPHPGLRPGCGQVTIALPTSVHLTGGGGSPPPLAFLGRSSLGEARPEPAHGPPGHRPIRRHRLPRTRDRQGDRLRIHRAGASDGGPQALRGGRGPRGPRRPQDGRGQLPGQRQDGRPRVRPDRGADGPAGDEPAHPRGRARQEPRRVQPPRRNDRHGDHPAHRGRQPDRQPRPRRGHRPPLRADPRRELQGRRPHPRLPLRGPSAGPAGPHRALARPRRLRPKAVRARGPRGRGGR